MICRKANRKLRPLVQATPYMYPEKRKILMNLFIDAQFNYCPLTWMLQKSNKTKHLHEKCLRFIHNNKLSSYEQFLEKDASVSVHHRNTQSLACTNVSFLIKLQASTCNFI